MKIEYNAIATCECGWTDPFNTMDLPKEAIDSAIRAAQHHLEANHDGAVTIVTEIIVTNNTPASQ